MGLFCITPCVSPSLLVTFQGFPTPLKKNKTNVKKGREERERAGEAL